MKHPLRTEEEKPSLNGRLISEQINRQLDQLDQNVSLTSKSKEDDKEYIIIYIKNCILYEN